MAPLTFILFIGLLINFDCGAEQSSFSKKDQGANYQFSYQWLDHQRDLQSMTFPLNKTTLFDRFRQFRAYKPDMAEKSVQRAIKKHLEQQPLSDVQVNFNRIGNSYSLDIKGREQEKVQAAYAQIKALEQTFMQKYLAKNYYHRFVTHDHILGIKPDHVRIAQDSVIDLKPMKTMIIDRVSIKNIRRVVNFVLGYIQSIPYSSLASRATSSGAGFSTPLKLLWENQGDCDSKLTLTAALLRALMPRIKMVFVYIDQHAFIGIDIMPRAGEVTLSKDNVTYVLADPTGPAMLILGQLSSNSERAVNNGHYVTEAFH